MRGLSALRLERFAALDGAYSSPGDLVIKILSVNGIKAAFVQQGLRINWSQYDGASFMFCHWRSWC